MSPWFVGLMIVSGVVAFLDSGKPDQPQLHTDKTIAKIHECHDKGVEPAITRDYMGEHVVCNKSWAQWKKDIKARKFK